MSRKISCVASDVSEYTEKDFCDFSSKIGRAFTKLHHSSEEKKEVLKSLKDELDRIYTKNALLCTDEYAIDLLTSIYNNIILVITTSLYGCVIESKSFDDCTYDYNECYQEFHMKDDFNYEN